MKKIFFITAMTFVCSYAFADNGGKKFTSPQTSILGEWTLGSRSCTSNTPISDGIIIGPDQISVRFNADKSYNLKRLISGCETNITGTYTVEAMKIIFTSTFSQSCTDTFPQPMPETYSMYAAHLNETKLVLVATGNKATACPASDALILNYERVQ